jgi:hypothetical protein
MRDDIDRDQMNSPVTRGQVGIIVANVDLAQNAAGGCRSRVPIEYDVLEIFQNPLRSIGKSYGHHNEKAISSVWVACSYRDVFGRAGLVIGARIVQQTCVHERRCDGARTR